MKSYSAKFIVEVDDTYELVHNLFEHQSVKIEFFHSIAPPHKVEYTIGPLSSIGVDNWKEKFTDLGCKYRLLLADWDSISKMPRLDSLISTVIRNPKKNLWLKRNDNDPVNKWYVAEHVPTHNETIWNSYGSVTNEEAKYLHENKIIEAWHLYTDKTGAVAW